MAGQSHLLLAAHLLVGLPSDGIRCFHLLFPEHSLVMAANATAERLHLGLAAQMAPSREELAELTLKLVARQVKNCLPLVV